MQGIQYEIIKQSSTLYIIKYFHLRILDIEVTNEEMRSADLHGRQILGGIIYMWGYEGQVPEKMTEKIEYTVNKKVNRREYDKVSEKEEGWFSVK